MASTEDPEQGGGEEEEEEEVPELAMRQPPVLYCGGKDPFDSS